MNAKLMIALALVAISALATFVLTAEDNQTMCLELARKAGHSQEELKKVGPFRLIENRERNFKCCRACHRYFMNFSVSVDQDHCCCALKKLT